MIARVVLPVVMLFVAASWGVAQDRDSGRRGREGRGSRGFRGGFGRGSTRGDKATLLRSDQVLKELKVSEEQKGKLEGILADYRDQGRELYSGLRDLDRDEREKAMAELRKKQDALRKKTGKKLDSVLTKVQVKRLDEIVLQQKGVRGLIDGPVAASLKLSEEQVGKIKAVFKTEEDERSKLFRGFGRGGRGGGGGGGGGDRGGFREIGEKMEKMRKDTETNSLAVLTKDQKEKFAALKGAAFKLERESRRGRGGRGGFDRGGRGGRGGERRRPPPDKDDAE